MHKDSASYRELGGRQGGETTAAATLGLIEAAKQQFRGAGISKVGGGDQESNLGDRGGYLSGRVAIPGGGWRDQGGKGGIWGWKE